MDDLRVVAHSVEECRRVIRRAMSIFQALGIQDAARKRRQVNQGGSPWAGSIAISTEHELFVTVSEEKWQRGRDIILNLLEKYSNVIEGVKTEFDFKSLENDRGFRVHLSMIFPDLVPYLI